MQPRVKLLSLTRRAVSALLLLLQACRAGARRLPEARPWKVRPQGCTLVPQRQHGICLPGGADLAPAPL
jgi:hypothetical protein